MKKLFTSLCFILIIASMGLQPVMAGIPTNLAPPIFKKNDDREVKNFDGVLAGGPINVVITLGNSEGVKFEGDAEAISTLITEVKGSLLIIRPQNSWSSWEKKYENKKITAYVSAKVLKSLTMSGSGTMTVSGKIKGTGLTTTLSGSGSIAAAIDVTNFTATISGSGSINVMGSADRATVTLSGSGSLTKKGLSVGQLSSVISGSGSVNLNVDDKINAVISGSGSINYSGNATVAQTIVGSGRVRKI